MPLGASKLNFLAKPLIAAVSGVTVSSTSFSGTTDNYSNQSVSTLPTDNPSAITIVFLTKPTYNLERLNYMGISENNNALRNNVFINTSGTIRWYNATSSGNSDRTSTETLTNNDWNLVAMSKDVGEGKVSGWMNGAALTFPSETITGENFVFYGGNADIGLGTARSGDHNNYMINGDLAFVGVWYNLYIDWTDTDQRERVWDSTNSRARFPGTTGEGYGWGQPQIFHYGNESTIASNSGNVSYTLTEGGTPSDGENYTASDVVTPDYTVPSSAFSNDGNTLGLWHFDNSDSDSSSNSRDFTTSGGFTTSEKVFGTHSGDLTDSTSDQFFRNTEHDWGPWQGSSYGDWTMEGWFYYETFADSSQDGNGTPLPNALVVGEPSGNKLSILFGFVEDSASNSGQLFLCSASDTTGDVRNHTVNSGKIRFGTHTWHHIAVTWDSSDSKYRLWANGYKVGESASAYTTPGRDESTGFLIGNLNAGNSNCYVDEVRVSNTLRYS